MSQSPADLKYARSHEWARLEDDGSVTVGISDHAQEALGDVVFVELPDVGTQFSAGDDAGVVESVKAASDVYAPLSGEVLAVNELLDDSPETVNSDPYHDGWFYRIKPEDVSELENLLSSEDYDIQCAEEA
jgi:glycine cleavage system H protein